MPEKNYSKRETDAYRANMVKEMAEQSKMLERIEAQTTKTNGRVSKLEDWSESAKIILESASETSIQYTKDKAWGKGAFFVIAGLLIGVPTICTIIFGLYIKNKDYEINERIQKAQQEVRQEIEQTLAEYDKIIINH